MNLLNKSGCVQDSPAPAFRSFSLAMVGLVAMLSLPLVVTSALAQDQNDDRSGLKLPEDLAARANAGEEGPLKNPDGSLAKYEIEETRSAGRLERVTVKRSNGLDEVYENKEIDSMFSKAEDEIGEVENVRRWTIGSW